MSFSQSDLASEKVRPGWRTRAEPSTGWRTLAQHRPFAYLAVTRLCLALGSFSDLNTELS